MKRKIFNIILSTAMIVISLVGCGKAVTPSSTAQTQVFSDVPSDYWAQKQIDEANKLGFAKGYDDGTFRPDNLITREELAQMLTVAFNVRALFGPATYDDIEKDRSTYNDISASGRFITSGPTFDPTANVTRETVAAAIVQAMGYTPREVKLSYTDADEVSENLKMNVGIADSIGAVLNHSDGYFHPKYRVSRAEAVTMIYNGVSYAGDGSHKSGNIAENGASSENASVVYMTKDISPEGLMKIYKALDWKPQGKVGVKLSTGEAGDTYYLHPELIGDLVHAVDGTIIECNTAYGGTKRGTTTEHRQVIEDHGFNTIANVDIMDEDGTAEIPAIPGSVHLQKDIVGSHLQNYDSMLVLSHFKGHAMGGFGGALKNISIGVASRNGKMYIHSGGVTDSAFLPGSNQDNFLESMAEAAGAVMQDKKGRMVYISVMNNLSVDCDCDSNPAVPTMGDIGIAASYDPVALDRACVDLVYADTNGRDLIKRMESRNGTLILDHAEELGMGSQKYKLENIDE